MAAYDVDVEPTLNILRLSAMWYVAQLINHAVVCVWNDICDCDIVRLVSTSISLCKVTPQEMLR
jgi:hypothetical protein